MSIPANTSRGFLFTKNNSCTPCVPMFSLCSRHDRCMLVYSWTDVYVPDQSDWSFYEQPIQLPLTTYGCSRQVSCRILATSRSAKDCFGDMAAKPWSFNGVSRGVMMTGIEDLNLYMFVWEMVFWNGDFYCKHCENSDRNHWNQRIRYLEVELASTERFPKYFVFFQNNKFRQEWTYYG